MVKLLAECQEEVEEDNYEESERKYNECVHLYKKLVPQDNTPQEK